MRLAPRGSDYFVALLLLTATGVVTGYTIFSALALGLAFAALISVVLLRLRMKPPRLSATAEPVKLVKGEAGRIALSMSGLRDSWARLEVQSAEMKGPVDTSLEVRGESGLGLLLRPHTAGRFRGLRLNLRVEDALGLFYREACVEIGGVVVDSLPFSLVSPLRRLVVPPLVVGEAPAGTPGRGQEFYGVQEYTERVESKDILWNRVAKEPERPFLARVREANSPESVTTEVVHYAVGSRWDLLDLQCEALGFLGRQLMLAGIRPEIVAPDGTRREAGTEEELAEAVMGASAPAEGEIGPGPRGGSDALVLVGDVGDEVLLRTARKPSVIIGAKALVADRFAVVFTGSEDLSGIVRMVLAR